MPPPPYRKQTPQQLRDRVNGKRKQRDETKFAWLGNLDLPPDRETLVALEGLGASGLAEKIRNEEITAEEVMYTFIARTRVLGSKEVSVWEGLMHGGFIMSQIPFGVGLLSHRPIVSWRRCMMRP